MKIRFWEQDENTQSSKRLIQLSLTAFAIVLCTTYLFITMDYVGTLAIFGGIMTVVTSMMGMGKKQENDRAKIEKSKV